MVTATAHMPGLAEGWGLTLELNPRLARLREAALEVQRSDRPGIATLPLVDARSWAAHTEDEDWLLWRARRVAERLRHMPIAISPGECIVGRPEFRHPTPAEQQALAEAEAVLKSIPPYPGGDAGHFHPDYERVFQLGLGGLREAVRQRRRRSRSPAKRTFYEACEVALAGLSDFVRRVADRCQVLAAETDEPDERDRLTALAGLCRHVATEPPRTFHEALELMFLTLVGLWFGEDHGLTTPGRMDQTLRRFYEADRAAGRLTRQEALELIEGLYIQLNMILQPGSAVSVIVGGRDAQGRDVTNELTYLCLAARMATRLVYPTVGLAWHRGTPAALMDFACRMLRTGVGDPAFFNDELIVAGLRDHGVTEADSYNWMNSTCVEVKVVGRSNMWVTAPYFNLAQALLDVMDRVADGAVPEPPSLEAFNALVQAHVAGLVREAAANLDAVWHRRAQTGCFPLASCFVYDCLEKGQDFDRGGARYNWVENSFVGLANLVDGLVAIDHLVYRKRELSLREFRQVLRDNFRGHEALRRRIAHRLPRYGNDDDAVDALAVQWADFLGRTTEAHTVGLHRYVPGYFCWVMHERFGSQTGATPDGRLAGFPLADGAGAGQGRERCGPTASILSTTKWSHRRAMGGLVHNIRFSKDLMRTDKDLAALRRLIETYLKRGGFEIQVNVLRADDLRDAQKHPERHRDLLVRVAGYSDYFVHLNPNMQAEIIARTEHGLG